MAFLTYFQPFLNSTENFTSEINAKLLNIPEELAKMEKTVSKETYQMNSKAWQNEHLSYMRLTHLSSTKRVEMFNFAIYPYTFYDVPIFASDFVIVGNILRVAVIDAMPLFPKLVEYEKNYINPFSDLYEETLHLGTPYERSLDWSFHFMGKNACLRQNIPLDNLETLHSIWLEYLELYLEIAKNAEKLKQTEEHKVINWHQAYNQEHLEVERKRNPLIHYFGKELGTRYLEEFLFKVQ